MIKPYLMYSTCNTWSELSFEGGGMSGAPCLLSQHLPGKYSEDIYDEDGVRTLCCVYHNS